MTDYKISWDSGSGVPNSQIITGQPNKEAAIKEWKKAWKHVPKRQITNISEIKG